MKIQLTNDEFKYLKNTHFENEHVKDILSFPTKSVDHIEIQVSEQQVEDLEAIFFEQLQKVGFDIDYNPTDEGRILENLLDKLSEV